MHLVAEEFLYIVSVHGLRRIRCMEVGAFFFSTVDYSNTVPEINNPEWQVKLKVLCILEALQEASFDAITGYLLDHASDPLMATLSIPQCKVKAGKVLHLIGLTDAPAVPTRAVPQPRAAAAVAAPVDLLDMDGNGGGPVANGVAGGVDLLDGFGAAPSTGPVLAPAPSAAPAGNLLDGTKRSAKITESQLRFSGLGAVICAPLKS